MSDKKDGRSNKIEPGLELRGPDVVLERPHRVRSMVAQRQEAAAAHIANGCRAKDLTELLAFQMDEDGREAIASKVELVWGPVGIQATLFVPEFRWMIVATGEDALAALENLEKAVLDPNTHIQAHVSKARRAKDRKLAQERKRLRFENT